MKNIALWGASGSIGQNTLKVMKQHPGYFNLLYASVHRNIETAVSLIRDFNPEILVVTDDGTYSTLAGKFAVDSGTKIVKGAEELYHLSKDTRIDLVVNALVGEAGLKPTYYALKAGNDVALANKESLVMAGEIVTAVCKETNTKILPIDSEHSAIWQCIAGEPEESIAGIVLTGSGGPFRQTPKEKFSSITPEMALKHPNWSMGKKITIDSATLMNKGLEFIEAYWLYPVDVSRIEVVIHPQSIIHSLVRFVDGSLKAQLGFPDMKIPIQYALTHPDRLPLDEKKFNLEDVGKLTFEKLDHDRFPALKLAMRVLDKGGIAPAVMNVVNEYAVYAFLERKISFPEIVEFSAEAVERVYAVANPDIEDIFNAAEWGKEFVRKKLG